MDKKIKFIIILGAVSFVLLLSTVIYWFCEVPVESKLEIHTVWGYGNKRIEKLTNDLNGEIISIGDFSEISEERYYLSVYAPLKDILLSKRVLEDQYIARMYYEWEIEPFYED